MILSYNLREFNTIKREINALTKTRDEATRRGDLFTARNCANQLKGISFILNMAGGLG